MVHQYQLNGYNIVLDTCSGSVHVVDEVAYDVIAMYPDHTADEIVAAMMAKYGDREDVTEADLRQCIDDVASLKESGKLWSPDTYEDLAFDFKNRNTVVKALCLHVAHTCNLNCSYCFASQGRYQGERALMSFEVGKRAMDFLIENSGSRRNLEVDFFGGEPLMNFDMVKKLVAYCREQEKIHNKNFRFTMTTNGMLIDDDVIDFCNKECHNVVLSLDGRKEVHDRFRKDYAGHGSYDTIVPKFQEFVKKRGDKGYYMRGTFTHYNTDFTNDIFHMADLGFTELSMEPVVCDPSDRRPLHLQAHFGLRLRHRVHGCDPLGRSVSLPSVRGRSQVPDGRYLEGCHQHGSPGRVQALQRLRPQGVPGLLGKALLLRRLCSQLLPRNRQHYRRVRVRL